MHFSLLAYNIVNSVNLFDFTMMFIYLLIFLETTFGVKGIKLENIVFDNYFLDCSLFRSFIEFSQYLSSFHKRKGKLGTIYK